LTNALISRLVVAKEPFPAARWITLDELAGFSLINSKIALAIPILISAHLGFDYGSNLVNNEPKYLIL
jgi:hypothetical protein